MSCRTMQDRCIIICSDGVWDEVTAEESVKIVMQYWDDLDPDAASRALCKESLLFPSR